MQKYFCYVYIYIYFLVYFPHCQPQPKHPGTSDLSLWDVVRGAGGGQVRDSSPTLGFHCGWETSQRRTHVSTLAAALQRPPHAHSLAPNSHGRPRDLVEEKNNNTKGSRDSRKIEVLVAPSSAQNGKALFLYHD